MRYIFEKKQNKLKVDKIMERIIMERMELF